MNAIIYYLKIILFSSSRLATDEEIIKVVMIRQDWWWPAIKFSQIKIVITDEHEDDFGTVPTPSISNAYAASMTWKIILPNTYTK